MDCRGRHIGAVGLAGMAVGSWLIEPKCLGKAERGAQEPILFNLHEPWSKKRRILVNMTPG